MSFRSSFGSSQSLLLVGLVVATGAVSVVVACTSDPRAGDATGGTSGGPASSGGGGSGIDAAIPDGPIDCGAAPSATQTFSKQALIGAAADCAAWHACGFQNAATALRSSVRAAAAAPSDDARSKAQTAWRAAMDSWSKMELFQFGPLANKASDQYHGRGLRSFVHPWPDLNRCQVETQIASKAYAGGWENVLASGRGLHAVEYSLFYPGADISCQPNSAAAQKWGTLGATELTQAKYDYAVAIVDNLAALALEMNGVWASGGENFKPKLVAAEGYGSEQEALTIIAWSLLYPEQEIKDLKLAPRAGVSTAPPAPETPFALVEIESIRSNLRAFRALFEGCGANGQGLGFDDWLVSTGNQALSTDLLAKLATAQAAVDAFPSFQTATEAEFSSLYEAIRPLSTVLKTSFFGSASPLNLKLPASAASDTD